MSNNSEKNVKEISKSKQKRLEQKNKAANQKKAERKAKATVVAIVILLVAIVALIVSIPFVKKLSYVKPVAAASDFSNMLNSNGFIDGVNASSLVNIPDINAISVDYSEIECSESDIDAQIDSILLANQIISEDESRKIENSDKVNIDYVGTIDGTAFEGGTYDGYDLTIGSGTFLEGFEDQLIGAKKGDTVEVKVKFPEDYNSAEVAGKDAVFTVKINGIYEKPAFDDDFVKNNLSEYADTAEGYKEYYKASTEKDKLATWVENYLIDNSSAKSYPNGYVKLLQQQNRYADELDYENMNVYTQMYMGYSMYEDFAAYVGMDEEAYAKASKQKAEEEAKNNLVYQAILEKEGVSVTLDDYKAYLGEGAEQSIDASYGDAYNTQKYVKIKAIELTADKVTINK